MVSFATVAELQAGWRALAPSEVQIAETLLERASALVAAECGACFDYNALPAARKLVVKSVVCDMVRFSFADGTAAAAAFDDGLTGGGLRVTDVHRKQLGIVPKVWMGRL